MTDGLTHPPNVQSGSDSWDTGNIDWEMCTDESSDHPTITAYASANVSRYKLGDANGSGSGDEFFEEYGLGHSRVSAETLTITIGGESETHEPSGKVYHEALLYITVVFQSKKHDGVYIIGDNNVYVFSSTDYRGPYSEGTSAYNPHGYDPSDTRYLTGKGRSGITNIKEELLSGGNTSASASAKAP